MSKEIERKFLVTGDGWKIGEGTLYRQGYLNTHPERTVRVRTDSGTARITIKGKTVGCTRSEFEYSIPPEDAEALLALCEKPVISKHRYRVWVEGLTWEVDEFHGENEGLVLAEIELESEDQEFSLPEWIGPEVTGDPRYYNANLVTHPFSRFSHERRS